MIEQEEMVWIDVYDRVTEITTRKLVRASCIIPFDEEEFIRAMDIPLSDI